MTAAFASPHFWTVRPLVKLDEGPLGYRYRLLHENGISWTKFCNAIGLALEEQYAAAQEIFVHVGRGKVVGKELRRASMAAFCPSCLSEDLYWRYLWEFKQYSVCHRHGQNLLKGCSTCGEGISWYRSKLTSCQCGALLSNMHAEAASPIASIVAEQMYRKLYGDLNECEWLRELSISQALTVLSLISQFLDKVIESRSFNRRHALEGRACTNDAVFDLLASPSALVEELIAYIGQHGSRGELTKKLCDAFYGKPSTCFTNHLEEIVRSSKHSLHELFRSHILRKEAVQCGQESRLACEIGLTRNQASEFFRYCYQTGHAQYFGQKTSELFEAIKVKTAQAAKSDATPNGCIALSSVLAPGERLFPRHAQLIRKILEGQVGLVCRRNGYEGVSSWVVLKRDLHRCIPHYRRRPRLLSLTSVARILGVTQPIASAWAVKGYLVTESREKMPFKVVSNSSLYTFQQNFISAGALARRLTVRRPNLIKMFMAAGIEPISGPQIDGYCQTLYRRDEHLLDTVQMKYQLDLRNDVLWWPGPLVGE